jgi:hypothetical protein
VSDLSWDRCRTSRGIGVGPRSLGGGVGAWKDSVRPAVHRVRVGPPGGIAPPGARQSASGGSNLLRFVRSGPG